MADDWFIMRGDEAVAGAADAVPAGRRFRRELILAASTELFCERGYGGVGIDEIGAAAGITGPGVYRHFTGKQEVLAAIIERATDKLLSGAAEITAAANGAQALEQLVDFHAGCVLESPSLVIVYFQEAKNVERSAGHRLRARQRLYLDSWYASLGEARPEVAAADRAVLVQGAVGLLNSAAYVSQSDKERIKELLTRSALAALLQGEEPGNSP